MDVCRDFKNRIIGVGKDLFLKIKKFKFDILYYFMIIIRLKDIIIKE